MYLDKTYLLVALNMQFAAEEQAFEGVNLSRAQLLEQDSVDINVAIQVIENLNQYAENPAWPALFGKQLGVTSHGPLGYAMVSAANPGNAVDTFLTWAKVRFDCYEYQIEQLSDCVEVMVTDTSGSDVFHHTFFQACARAFEVLVKTMLGSVAGDQISIHFRHHYSAQTERALLAEFDSALVFDSEQNKIVFSNPVWNMPSPLHDPHAYEFNIAECRQLLASREAQRREDIAIESALNLHFQHVIRGVKADLDVPQIEAFAEQFHVSERTLTRRLVARGTSYRKILDHVRRTLSEQLLKDSELLVEEIAETLGYHESANFCRAFKKWFGCTPSEYRQNHRSGAP